MGDGIEGERDGVLGRLEASNSVRCDEVFGGTEMSRKIAESGREKYMALQRTSDLVRC